MGSEIINKVKFQKKEDIVGKKKGLKKKTVSNNAKIIEKAEKGFFSKNQGWLYPLALSLLVLFLFFPITFGGLRTAGYDSIGSSQNLNSQWSKATGDKIFNNLAMFSGQPNYAFISSPPRASQVYHYLGLDFIFGTGGVHLLVGVLGLFFLLRYLRIGRMASFFAALGFILIPHWGVLFAIGHMWKFYAVLLIPICLLFYLKLLDKHNWQNLVFFSFFQVWQIQTNHYQIIYYTAMLMGGVTIAKLIEYKKDVQHLLRSGVFVLLSLIVVVGVAFQPMYLTQEYSKYTIRGAKTENGKVGLSKSYATSWSCAPKELLTLLIPRAFGGASGERYDISNPDYPHLSGRDIPGYWGDMPFSQGTDYAGVVLLLLAFIGVCLNWRKKMIKSLVFLSLLAVFLSFGRHFSLIYDLFFNFVPGFNKFRVPSMILILVEFIVAVLAGYGLSDVLQNKKEKLWTVVLINFAIFLGIGLLVWLFSGQFSFVSPSDRYDAQSMAVIKNIRKEFLLSDTLRFFVYLFLSFGLIVAYIKKWLKSKIFFFVLITGLLVVDFMQIQDRFLLKKSSDSYVNLQKNNEVAEKIFSLSAAEKFILAQKPEGEIFSPYRIYPVMSDFWATRKYSMMFQSIGGYSAAKLRIYQDLVDNGVVKGGLARNITNMLSAKYFLTTAVLPDEEPFEDLDLVFTGSKYNIYENREALPKGWFVRDYKVVKDKHTRFAFLRSEDFLVKRTALLEKDLEKDIKKPKNDKVELLEFGPHKIKFTLQNKNDGLFVVSSVYYPVGWHAYLDDEEVSIYKTNHVLSSVFVPAGQHSLLLEFAPGSMQWTKVVSQSFKIVWFVLFLLVVFGNLYRKRFKAKS